MSRVTIPEMTLEWLMQRHFEWLMNRIRQRERDGHLISIRYLHSEYRHAVEQEVDDGKA